MNQVFAKQFAKDWINAWNSHDVDRIASFYHEDCELSSPVISEISRKYANEIKGLRNMRRLWQSVFDMMPNLTFELVSTLSGVNSIVITYYGAYNTLSAVVCYFDRNHKIIKSNAFTDLMLNDEAKS